MISPEKNQIAIAAFGLAFLFAFAMVSRFRKQFMEWILLKMHEVFIQQNAMKLP
ncbi:MAG: hypothetical protein IPP93_08675 [Chitinophagaceae bacterium]|nr:hypothetical protein [Chitinophagaceae bacterium]